jgi:regulator of sigma E protease
VGEVVPGSPAAIAGLQTHDRIISIEGKRIDHTIDLITELASRPEKLDITYERNGASQTTSLLISYEDNGEPNLGIYFEPLVYTSERVGLFTAFGKGVEETYSVLKMTVKSIGLLFSGINVSKAVSGPIRLTYYVGAIASEGFKDGLKDGFSNMFRFLSLLSVFFFFMNLLPIPALDGGHIVLQLIEAVTRRAPKPAVIYRYQVIGFTIIIGILIFSTFNDVSFFISR